MINCTGASRFSGDVTVGFRISWLLEKVHCAPHYVNVPASGPTIENGQEGLEYEGPETYSTCTHA